MMRLVVLMLMAGCASDSSIVGKVGDDPCVESTWFHDADGDGHAGTETLNACQSPGEGWLDTTDDCDDANPDVFPGAIEICNEVDDDCNVLIDDDPVDAGTWYTDADADTYGDPNAPLTACVQPAGSVTNTDDCDDTSAAIFPGALEICNNLDDDCNTLVDDDPTDLSTFYEDADSDAHGNPEVLVEACFQPDGFVTVDDDCDDTDGLQWDTCINPPVVHGAACTGGYPLTTYEVSAPANPELHLVGVYEPTVTAISVDVDRATDVILVLSSYSPVDWTVNATSRTNLLEVYVNSYSWTSSTVVAPSGVPTNSGWFGAYAYAWPYSDGGSDTPALVSQIERYYGATLTSFTGCYQASGFVVEE
jgi:hypothetical protein